jgi:hypothetical protein
MSGSDIRGEGTRMCFAHADCKREFGSSPNPAIYPERVPSLVPERLLSGQRC